MNRSFYRFAIFIWSLVVIIGLFEAILRIQVGTRLLYYDSYILWFSGTTVVSLSAAFVLLRYYYHKKYRYAYYSWIIVIGGIIVITPVIITLLVTHQRPPFYLPLLIIMAVISAIHGISLIFTNAGERPWLKVMGVFMTLLNSIVITILIIIMVSPEFATSVLFQRLENTILVLGSLFHMPFILNFIGEMSGLAQPGDPDYIKRTSSSEIGLAGIFGLIVVVFVITSGSRIYGESSKTLYWERVNAEKTQAFVDQCESREYVNKDNDKLDYVLLKPLDYQFQIEYPLVLCLPYGGYESPVAQFLARDHYRNNYPAFIMVPRCPEGKGWGGIPNYPTIDQLVFDAIAELENEVSIDEDRIYVSGISRGGYGSWHFISTRPDLFAAAIPICGGGNPELASNLVNRSIWAFHGALDKNVPVSGSRDMIEAIKDAGGNPHYTEYENDAHNIWNRVQERSDVWKWLFEQKKSKFYTKGVPDI